MILKKGFIQLILCQQLPDLHYTHLVFSNGPFYL